MVKRALQGMRAVIHARESKLEAKAGNRSTTEQVDESREWCEQEGIKVAHVVVEDGVGASRLSKGIRSGKQRDDWEHTKRLLTDGDDEGPLDILVAWSSTRSQRDLDEYVKLRRICVDTGVLWCYGGRVYDMTDGDDRFRTAIDGAVGERDSHEIHKNVMRGIRGNIKAGKPHGSVLFGYRRIYHPETKTFIRQEPHLDQAWVVQWIYRAYLAGHSVDTIAEWLQFASLPSLATTGGSFLPTPRGAAWSSGYVRKILRNAAYKGRRLHNGEDVGEAVWPPLIDEQTFDDVQQRLDAHSTRPNRVSPRKQLLSGVARCSVCDGRLTFQPVRTRRSAYYYCRHNGHVARNAEKLDAYVKAILLERLARPDVNAALDDDEPVAVTQARAELAELKAELEQAKALRRGEVPGKRLSVLAFAEIETDLLPQIERAEAKVRSGYVPIDIAVPMPGRLVTWWGDELTGEQRREVLAAFIVAVTVRPSDRKGRQPFDPSKIEIEWRR